MKVVEVAFSAYSVTDLKRARCFYEGILGLSVARHFGNEENGSIEYNIGTATLEISNILYVFDKQHNGTLRAPRRLNRGAIRDVKIADELIRLWTPRGYVARR